MPEIDQLQFRKNEYFSTQYHCFDVFCNETKIGEVLFTGSAHHPNTHEKWLATDVHQHVVLKDVPDRYFDSRYDAAVALLNQANLQHLL